MKPKIRHKIFSKISIYLLNIQSTDVGNVH